MNAAEFIQQYGKIEMLKMMKREEQDRRQAAAVVGGPREDSDGLGLSGPMSMRTAGPKKTPNVAALRRGTLMGADLKDKMRNALAEKVAKELGGLTKSKVGLDFSGTKSINNMRRTVAASSTADLLAKSNNPT